MPRSTDTEVSGRSNQGLQSLVDLQHASCKAGCLRHQSSCLLVCAVAKRLQQVMSQYSHSITLLMLICWPCWLAWNR